MRVLASFEPPPLPVHVVHAVGGPLRPACAFVDLVAPRLRQRLSNK